MITQIWAHIASGEKYAVEIDGNDQVVGAAGPLHYSEIDQAIAGDWDADRDVTEDIKADADSYRDVTGK